MNTKQKMTYVIGGKYTINEKIGEGAFGKIFLGENKNTGKQVAVKIERGDIKSLLRNEARVYACLLYTSPSPRDRQKSRMPSSA